MKFKKHFIEYKCKRILKKHFDEIVISKAFRQTPPRPEKLQGKTYAFFVRYKLDPIIVDKNYILIDGYCAYLIAKENNYRGRKLKIYMAKKLDVTDSRFKRLL